MKIGDEGQDLVLEFDNLTVVGEHSKLLVVSRLEDSLMKNRAEKEIKFTRQYTTTAFSCTTYLNKVAFKKLETVVTGHYAGQKNNSAAGAPP